MVEKIKEIGLKLEEIDLNILEEILSRIEHEIHRYLREKLPPKTDYDLILRIDKDDVLTIYIDLGVVGSYEDIIDYEAIVNDAVNYARKLFEKEINRFRGGKNTTT